MIADHPERMEAWRWDEEHAAHYEGLANPAIAFYRKDVPNYAALFEQVRRNPRLPGLDPDDSGMDVFVDGCEACGV